MKQTTNPRQLALESLTACEKDGKFANLEVNASLVSSGLSEADAGLYTRLVYGVLERKITLDYIIDGISDRPSASLDCDVLTAIRLGLYQMLYMDRIPDHAAVSESVELVPRSKRGFVNAVLRTFLRNGKAVSFPTEGDFAYRLSVKYSFPEELCRLYMDCYGDECAEGILAASNGEPPLSLRVNTLRSDIGEIAERLCGRASEIAPSIVLTKEFSAAVKEGIASGDFFVQDEASRICTAVLDAKPGETVVDTCACPGGKTFSAALDMENRGTVYAFDLHKNKLSLIEKGAKRLGIGIIRTAENDARCPVPHLVGKADRVLCDAPCSGLGVIAKKPDIRYKSLDSVKRLPEIQYDVLCGAAEYVREGGVLVYSTCTLNTAENEEIVRKFLVCHKEFAPESDEKYGLIDGMRTFFPHKDGCDGFFIAKMRRREK
ncbi:MAG: 16S rRNA (cytosine(967)-C(5))-methyltransferase RsmB [Ruminococcaceae bacterium]|nr:16S rRNA (cytosine(967)-C(5))-methyltransferase RsmB [Oscillospiraceae bacterium]